MNSLENKVIYQIYPKSFLDTNNDGIGDLQGIINKLDYLKDLGVDYIWLSPINKSPQNDNGYDISDYDQINPCFGNKQDFINLINEAASKNIKIMMDLVLNHTSTNHEWFLKALEGHKEYQDYYYFQEEVNPIQSIFLGSAWNYVPSLNKYYFCFFDKTQADLNWNNPKVRMKLYQSINKWIELGVEGFRLDVIDHIAKDLDNGITSNGPKLLEYLKELNNKTFTNKILTVGECWNASLEEMEKICQKDGLTQAFHFEDITHTNGKTKWDQQPFNLNKLASILSKWHNEY
ncbi:MAG: alpha-amylase family glycosyl hydrolase, partial [Bacilli bacterium]